MNTAAKAQEKMKPEAEPARVLVVEDEHKVASALKEGLEGEGYEVTSSTPAKRRSGG